MTGEVYRLTLEHFMRYGEDVHRLEEPLVVQMIVDRQYAPTAICLNRMLEMMRNEVLNRATENPQLNSK